MESLKQLFSDNEIIFSSVYLDCLSGSSDKSEMEKLCEEFIKQSSQNPAFIRQATGEKIPIRLIDLHAMSEERFFSIKPVLPTIRNSIHEAVYHLPKFTVQ